MRPPSGTTWVVVREIKEPSGEMLSHYWLGPNGYSNMWALGSWSEHVARFRTKFDAEQALRKTFGPPRKWRGAKAIREQVKA